MSEEQLRIDALEYHELPTPGKLSTAPTKALANQRDPWLAYSPGVAYACTAIQENPELAARYTAQANLVAVITNGTAVLGLGNIGALADKPVMEGKGCLFKKVAGIVVRHNLMGGLVGRKMWIEGWFARMMYLSLYKMHELALPGFWKVTLDTAARVITRRTEAHVKLH